MNSQDAASGKAANYSCQSDEESSDLRRGPWTVDEDFTLINYIAHHGEGRWNSLARCAGLKRTGKSCRLRWLNYLRPDVRRGNITLEEQLLILELHSRWGNRWSKIAQHLPGRTDNEIKNYWRTRVQKHAKQLKCDVNSKQFKDTMRYLWMPRLVERIHAANATTTTVGPPPCTYHTNHPPSLPQPQVYNHTPTENSAASSDSFGTPLSDSNYNNYPLNNNQDKHLYPPAQLSTSYGDQSLTSPPTVGYFNQGFEFMEQNNYNGQWILDGTGDVSTDNLWNVDDVWFLQHHFNTNA